MYSPPASSLYNELRQVYVDARYTSRVASNFGNVQFSFTLAHDVSFIRVLPVALTAHILFPLNIESEECVCVCVCKCASHTHARTCTHAHAYKRCSRALRIIIASRSYLYTYYFHAIYLYYEPRTCTSRGSSARKRSQWVSIEIFPGNR